MRWFKIYNNEIFTSCSRGDIMTTPPHGPITIASHPILIDHCNTQSPIILHTQHTDLKYKKYIGQKGYLSPNQISPHHETTHSPLTAPPANTHNHCKVG